MKLLLLLLLPITSFCQTKQHQCRIAATVTRGYSESTFERNEPFTRHEFTIEYNRIKQSKHPLFVEVDSTVIYFYAHTYKDTVVIDPSGLDSLVIKSKYIKISGMLFKKEDKQ
jgi:hypothetical protein